MHAAMDEAEHWLACRIGYVETLRAVARVTGPSERPARAFQAEWPAFRVLEIDAELCERAAEEAIASGLRTLDALHVAAALLVADADLVVACWDAPMRSAMAGAGLTTFPDRL